MINSNKNYFLIFFSIFFIFSCGGGGGSEPFSLTLPNLSANNNLSLDEDNDLNTIIRASTNHPSQIEYTILSDTSNGLSNLDLNGNYSYSPDLNFFGNDIYQIPRFVDTLIISFGSTIFVIILSTISGYSLSRMNIKGKEIFLLILISTRIIPPIAIAIPLFLIYKNLLILDTHIGIILAHTLMNLPLAVLLMKSFFDDIPKDIDEAAVMDGASQFYVFWKLIMPLTKKGMSVTAVLCFIFSWTEFIFVLILTQTKIKTITLASITLGSDWSNIATIGTIAIIPTFIIIFLTQKNLARGLTLGSNYK